MAEFTDRDQHRIEKSHDMLMKLGPMIERHDKIIDRHEKEIGDIEGDNLVQAEQIDTLETGAKKAEAMTGKTKIAIIGACGAIVCAAIKVML